MKKVEKKVWPEYFQEIFNGKKTFELRLNDFDIKEGDILILREYDPKTKEYTGRKLEKDVGYVGKWKIDDLTMFWPRKDIDNKGIQVISLK
jgi:ASC-1-like (ASCH) protein